MKYTYMVCLDGSEASHKAYSWAEAEALQDQSRETELILLNIVSKTKLDFMDVYYKERKELAVKGVESFSKDLENLKIPHQSLVVETHKDPRHAIIEYAEKYRVDMVLIGYEDKSTLKKLVDGHNVADFVLKHCACPVLIFKDLSQLKHIHQENQKSLHRSG
ncbi:hypothetical protein DFA_04487 [Cavenderia fasciculata]|uniref:UspA domain-containing protein n=1 Tax=Cavenderia fasciculata TaxID=261658 RepID=F4PPQ6_CACFS|nr:uncharacterized protein DFA_04487 [Cavenderia fasciculata]EGG22369.1 hypothetical protein DFA_04487 [Cavenderia fasciculata]|eukprot:XP_004360220.1 hypothetical protein DFA_04487 [Cavenderia fasciculata]